MRMPLQEAIPELEVREPTAPAQSIRPRRVLLIDDNHDAARSMGMLLKHLGYEVELAYTGPEGLEAARRTRPDVILCDIGLPGLDGFSVARVLRSESPTRDVYLIAISGYGQTEDIRKALDAGFDLHLIKPVDFSRLELALNSGRHKADIPAEI